MDVRKLPVLLLVVVVAVLSVPVLSHLLSLDVYLNDASEGFSSFTWFNLVHGGHNAFLNWKLSELSLLLPKVMNLGNSSTYFLSLFFSLSVFFITSLLLFRVLGNELDFLRAILSSLGLCLVLLLLFGLDVVVISTLAWLPLATLALLLCWKSDSPNYLYLTLLFISSCLLAESACHFSLFAALFSLLMAKLMLMETSVVISDVSHVNGAYKKLLVPLTLLVPSVVVLLLIPEASFPDYPFLSRVVSDDNIKGVIRPLIGVSPPLPIIERPWIQAEYFYPALLSCLSLLALAFVCVDRKDNANSNFYYLSLFLAFCLLLDVLPPDSFASIMPLYSLSRIIPNTFLFPLAPFALVFSFFCLLLFAQKAGRGYAGVLLFLVLFVCGLENPGLGGKEFSSDELTSDQISLLVSPSSKIIRDNGLFLIREQQRFSTSERKLLAAYPHRITSSNQMSEITAKAASDGNMETRWSTTSGMVGGRQWIQIELAEPVTIAGIFLEPGKWGADYPGGIRIVSSDICTAISFEEGEILSDQDHWQGEILFTDEGFPYYGAQANVSIFFEQNATVRCLRIEQTRSRGFFDWSVAEVGFHVPQDA
ncbi:hypothetical protein BVY02_01450 [bacterium J17]|nr:hypothetical protein BVY02_01450 [bacterium J17]